MLTLPALAKYLTDGFKIAKMRVEYPIHPEWEVSLDPHLLPLLNQPFRYLAKGAQAFVFESEDQTVVLKFFRFHTPYSELKISDLFNAAHIAYQQLKEETGLLYIHLNPTQLDLPTIHCTDAVGRSYSFRLDECRFALQKRAKSFPQAIQEALADPREMQKRIDQWIELLVSRTEKGIFNSDPSLSRNFGFLDNRAIEFDFGNFKPSPHSREVEIERYASRFRSHLKESAPEWIAYLDAELKKI